MNCEEVSLLLENFYDGEASALEEYSIEEHLTVCPSCSLDFEKLCGLDQLLEKSAAPPPPSAMLDRKLMAAFERKHKKHLKSPVWWQRIFVGSVSVPKPVFAAVAIAVAITAATMIERNRSVSSGVSAPLPESPSVVSIPLQSEIIEKTKTVEVPVIKERVVTRTVYVEKQTNKAINPPKSLMAQKLISGKTQRQMSKADGNNLALSVSVENGEYITRANLSGFQPIAELKTRIIQAGKSSEK